MSYVGCRRFMPHTFSVTDRTKHVFITIFINFNEASEGSVETFSFINGTSSKGILGCVSVSVCSFVNCC